MAIVVTRSMVAEIGLLSNSQSWKSGLHDRLHQRRPGGHPGRRRSTAPPRTPAWPTRCILLIGDGRIALDTRLPSERELTEALGGLADHGHPGVRRAARRRVRRGPARCRHLHPGARRPEPRPRPGAAPPARRRRRDRPQLRGPVGPARHGHGVRRRRGRPAGVPRRARLLPRRAPQLQAAIAASYDARGLPTAPDQIMVTPGALTAASIVAQAFTGAGRPGAGGDADLSQRDRRAAPRRRAAVAVAGRPRRLGPRRRRRRRCARPRRGWPT